MRSELRGKLRQYQLRPIKSLGQNFLVDLRVISKMIEAAELKKDELVLEIGPGLGGLTREIAKQAKEVIAIELDKRLIKVCRQELAELDNIELINQDILKIDLTKLINRGYKVVSSLPYQISSPFLRKLIKTNPKPTLVVLLIQREVAERTVAQPGGSDRGYLTVLVQAVYQVKIISLVSREAFWPQPRVESAIIALTPRSKSLVKNWSSFVRTIQAGFGQKRKRLANSLANRLNLDKKKVEKAIKSCRLEQDIRAQDLTITDWRKLTQRLED